MSDVEELRGVAQRMREPAADTHGAGATMGDSQSVDFVSNAARRLRADLRHDAAKADHAARELQDAARALMHHAQEVEDRLAEIARIEHFFGGLIKDAERELGKVAHGARDLAGDAARVLDLARHAPPPGHPGWLDFKRLLP